ncbi:hypothetical protein N7540_010367 [Penicillium herquei]|nr:hypothetical protein N7540_010367 [Penicillium herquei]
MSADPPRRRRSSISTHFQRVFHVDSAEKRQSRGQDSSQDPSRLSWTPSDGHDPKLEATAAHSGPEETGVSSFNFSSNSQIPSLDTLESSPSVLQGLPSNEKSMSQPMVEVNDPNMDRSNICSSPTWGKKNLRKERRATKRLEAERNELEKRLLHLEESQSRVDNGIFDRASRRLSKKHPQGSSSRSSSTGSSRLRSSSITAFFTGSRRASRANSVNEDDGSSQPAGPPGPPSVPLALSERFGADVSRELADRHGTTLIPTSLTQLPSSQSQLTHPPHQLPRSLHTTPKSDDLRENWKTAQEWQKKNDGHGMSTELLARRLDSLGGGRSQQHNVELIDTNPMSDLKSLKAMESFAGTSSTGATVDQSMGSSPKSPLNSSTARITTARQFRELSDSTPETPNGSPSSQSKGSTRSSSSILASMKNGSPKRTQKEASSQPQSRQYISSPLAMHPNTPEQPNRSPNRNFSLPLTNVQVPEPLRIVKPSPPEESQGRNRQSIPSWLKTARDENRRETWSPRSESLDVQKAPLPTLPLKHPGRRSLEENASKTANNGAPPGFSLRHSGAPGSQEPTDEYPLVENKTSEEQSTMDLNKGDHGRSPSLHSSDGASSYDTADEEVLDVPKKRPSNAPPQAPDPGPKKPSGPTPEIMARSGLPMAPTNLRGNPPLAPSGPLSMLRKKPMQKVKSPRAEDVIAKLFVICCQCKYWHDMPSEMYAKLACPERLPSESRLARTFSRRNSVRNAIFASDPNDPRRMPLPRRAQPQNEPPNARGPPGDGRGAPASQSPPLYRPQCCWCGHNMSKSCCQGWTALVHMRERYH